MTATTSRTQEKTRTDLIDVVSAFFAHHRGLPGMKGNFREFGASFGAKSFGEFVRKAREFYAEGMKANEIMNYYVVDLKDGRVAVDFKGSIRGIYTKTGRPLAFFRPNYRRAGFLTPQQELAAFFADAKGIPAYAIV